MANKDPNEPIPNIEDEEEEDDEEYSEAQVKKFVASLYFVLTSGF